MPVRGKILNCLKEDYPRIFKSDIIMDLMRVLGCGVEIRDKRIKNLGAFDLDNLNWSKVIICTDADVDGYHIRTLILTMLYRLVPTLIDEGYVYIAESPLYEINCKEKTYFAYTELEKNGILAEIGDQKCSINRSKGLGENDPDMMWLTTMNPETRRLIKVEPEDVAKMETMFNLLLGNDEPAASAISQSTARSISTNWTCSKSGPKESIKRTSWQRRKPTPQARRSRSTPITSSACTRRSRRSPSRRRSRPTTCRMP